MRQNNRLLTKSSSIVLGATIFMSGVILSSPVFADDSVVDIINVTVPSTCTFGMGGGGTYARSMDNGETAVIVANNITTSCNDASGYAIYAIGFSGNSYSGTNTDLISNLNTNYNIKTDGTGSYGSSWKMKITAVTNATVEGSYGSFQNIPSTYAKVASYNTSTTEGTITPSYQINISNTQIADTYTGKVKYTLVHPATAAAPPQPLKTTDCPANSICYAPNDVGVIGNMSSLGTITASATAGKQTTVSGASDASAITSSTTEITLIAPNYAREGYGFAGWSTDYVANNSSIIYGPNETITVAAGSLGSNGMILYPAWVASAGDMQQWSGCSGLTAATYNSTTGKISATLNQITALTDTRDGNVYTVAKLADGKCWMIENLRLNDNHTTSAADIAKAQNYSQSNVYGNFIGLANSEDRNIDCVGNPNSIYSTDGSTTINVGSNGELTCRIPRYNKNNTNLSANATNSFGTSLEDSHNSNNNHVRWYSYGNYYNWVAAMATTKYYSQHYNADNTEEHNSDAAGTSLCPKGWELPLGYLSTGDLTGEQISSWRIGSLSYLDRKMGGTGQNQTSAAGTNQSKKWRSFPNNYVFSGSWLSDTSRTRGTYGRILTRSAYAQSLSEQRAYSLMVTINTLNPNQIYNKGAMASIRCIAQ